LHAGDHRPDAETGRSLFHQIPGYFAGRCRAQSVLAPVAGHPCRPG